MNKLLGFVLSALPGIAGFAVYGVTQNRGMSALSSAALAGSAFAAADIAGQMLSGGSIAGLAFERVGAMLVNPQGTSFPAFTASQRSHMGYLAPERVGACFGSC